MNKRFDDNDTPFQQLQKYTYQFLEVIFRNEDYRPKREESKLRPGKFHWSEPRCSIGHAWNSGLYGGKFKKSPFNDCVYSALNLIAKFSTETPNFESGSGLGYRFEWVLSENLQTPMSSGTQGSLIWNLYYALKACKIFLEKENDSIL